VIGGYPKWSLRERGGGTSICSWRPHFAVVTQQSLSATQPHPTCTAIFVLPLLYGCFRTTIFLPPSLYCRSCTTVVEAKGLSLAVSRMRRITQQLPPCLFVPHTVKAWHTPPSSSSSSSGGQQQQQCAPAVVAGEALATVGVSTLASLLQEVSCLLLGRGGGYTSAMP
jgi:hypothetical protein